MLIEEDEMIPAVKFNSIFLNKTVENQVTRVLEEKTGLENAVMYYQFASIFRLQKFAKISLKYTERCFTMVCKSKNFLQLDFAYLERILFSSELEITSELEVLNAADKG